MINKFGLSDSLIDAARKVMAGEKVEEEPKVDDQPKEEQQLDEAGFVNRKDNMPAGKKLGKVMKGGHPLMKKPSKPVKEDMSVHLSMNKDGKSYTVKKEKTGGRLKKGETVSDTHVDDLKDSGVKVHHEEAEPVDEVGGYKLPSLLAEPPKKKNGKEKPKPDVKEEFIDEEMFWDFDIIAEMTDAEFDEILETMTDEEILELHEGLLGAIGRGVKKVAGAAGRGVAAGAKKAAHRMSAGGRADAAEKKTAKLTAKTDRVAKVASDRKRLAQAKAGKSLARQKLKAVKAGAKAEKKELKSRLPSGGPRPVPEALDPVGQEDGDVDNDGDTDSSDNYLKKRRKAVKKAIASQVKESKGLKTFKRIDELSRETLGSYTAKASDARGHRKLSTKKVDNRYTGVARAADKLDKKNMEEENIEEIAPLIAGVARAAAGAGKVVAKGARAAGKGVKKAAKNVKKAADGVAMDYVARKDEKKKAGKAALKAHQKEKGIEEAAPMATAKQQSGVDRIRRSIIKKKGPGVQNPLNLPSKPLDKAATYSTKKADRTPNFATKVKRGDVKEDTGDEKVASSKQSAALAKHYYMKAKGAQGVGNKEAAAKYMAAAKKFYRKGEGMQAKEKEGRPEGAAEGNKPVDFMDRPLGVGEDYFNELEIEEIMAAEDDIYEVRVTKAAKDEPEHIAMQLRKVVSLKGKHSGVQFNKSSDKVDTKTAQGALSRYNSAKPAEKEELQKHMSHSHDALKHVASGGDLSKSPGAPKKYSALESPLKKSDHYN